LLHRKHNSPRHSQLITWPGHQPHTMHTHIRYTREGPGSRSLFTSTCKCKGDLLAGFKARTLRPPGSTSTPMTPTTHNPQVPRWQVVHVGQCSRGGRKKKPTTRRTSAPARQKKYVHTSIFFSLSVYLGVSRQGQFENTGGKLEYVSQKFTGDFFCCVFGRFLIRETQKRDLKKITKSHVKTKPGRTKYVRTSVFFWIFFSAAAVPCTAQKLNSEHTRQKEVNPTANGVQRASGIF
jgi:hypothetical protein